MFSSGSHHTPVRRILAPLDGAATSEAVVPYVAGMAAALNARLVLFRAVRSDYETEAAGNYLENVAAKLRESGMGVATHTGKGRPSAAIVEAARVYEADMIAMTGHAQAHGGRQDLLGSTAHHVLEQCAMPVLVLRTSDRAWMRPSAVVVGLDGSESSHVSIGPAVSMAQSMPCELVLVRAVEPVAPLGGAARYYGTVDQFAQGYLDDIKKTLAGSGLHIRTHVGKRAPEQELLGVAGSRHGSIIVLSTTGLTGRPNVLGSITDRVVRSQSHPVLAIPVH
jgi:nucleotide-binding universal stress UspA family protein